MTTEELIEIGITPESADAWQAYWFDQPKFREVNGQIIPSEPHILEAFCDGFKHAKAVYNIK